MRSVPDMKGKIGREPYPSCLNENCKARKAVKYSEGT